MKATGANAIRLFNTNPTTLAATQQVVNTNPGLYNITQPFGKEHVNFMDYAAQNGLKVVFPLFSDAEALRTYTREHLYWLIKNQIDEVGNHPALLMYQMGTHDAIQRECSPHTHKETSCLFGTLTCRLCMWLRRISFATRARTSCNAGTATFPSLPQCWTCRPPYAPLPILPLLAVVRSLTCDVCSLKQ